MINQNACLHAAILAGICSYGLATQAAAQSTYEISVIQHGVAKSTEYALAPGGHDVVVGSTEWAAPVSVDPGSPFHGLQGACFGMTEFKGDDVVGGGGFCTYDDADGDRYVSKWVPTSTGSGTGSAGEWTAVSGTGKFEGVTGAGVYQTGRIAGDLRTRRLTGQLTLQSAPPGPLLVGVPDVGALSGGLDLAVGLDAPDLADRPHLGGDSARRPGGVGERGRDGNR